MSAARRRMRPSRSSRSCGRIPHPKRQPSGQVLPHHQPALPAGAVPAARVRRSGSAASRTSRRKSSRTTPDGWVLLQSTPADLVKRAMAAPDWPSRPMTIVKTCRMVVGETRADVLEAAQRTYEVRRKARAAQIEQPGHPLAPMISFDEFVTREIVGTPDECLARIADVEATGFNYIRLAFDDPLQLEAVARLILPPLRREQRGVTQRSGQHRARADRALAYAALDMKRSTRPHSHDFCW